MSLTELETKRCERELAHYMEQHRPPPHIRHQLDLSWRITGQSVEIFEIRPDWKDPNEKMERPVAKATFVRKDGLWHIYWRRQDMKWHSYEPEPIAPSVAAFLNVVERDEHACFFG